MPDCPFCSIIAGVKPAHTVFENDKVMAFAPLKHDVIARGHILLVPKKHYDSMYDMPSDALGNIMEAAKQISGKLKGRFGADGVNLLHASGKAAQHSCFHFHIHLLPRSDGDGLDTWPRTGYVEKDYPAVYDEMARLLSS